MEREIKKEDRIAKEIFENVGSKSNVEVIRHCMTRVRLETRDYSKVDIEGLKKIDGVLGVVEDENLQIIVGPGIVNKVAGKMCEIAGVKLGEKLKECDESLKKENNDNDINSRAAETKAALKAKNNTPLKRALKSIANIFVPLIPAFVGAGILAGISSILTNMGTAGSLDLAKWNQIITILNVIKNAIYSYLAIYVGINSASEFGATPALGGVIGGTTLLFGMSADMPLTNIFTGKALTAGQGGIIGVIIAVWILSYIEKFLHRVVPNSVDIIVTPTITLLLTGLITIFLLMPFAGFISDNLLGAINWVLNTGGAVSGFILGAGFLPLVVFGLHQVLTPIHIQMINETGMTTLLPILAMAGAGQVGASLALFIRCRRNKPLANMIKGALPVGFLGVGEPLIYGVTLPLGRPFITACLGGGIGGAALGFFGNIGATAVGPSGIALIPLIANSLWIKYVIGLVCGYIGGFIFTYLFGTPKDATLEVAIEEE